MKLSVIIPYYNTNALIGRTLDSLLDQDLAPSDFEIIVVDDGSDEDPVVVKEYADRCPQVSYYRNEHIGVSAARNFGMSLAKGDWIYFCDSDDYIQSNVLGGIIDAAEQRGLDMLHARRTMLKPSDPVPAPRRNFDRVSETQTGMEYLGNPPYDLTWSMCVSILRRSFIEDLGLQFEDIFYVEDCLFKLEVLKNVKKVAFIDVDLYYYMQNEVSILHSKKQHDSDAHAEATLRSIEAKTAIINDPATPESAARSLAAGRRDDSIGLFTNVLRYCPVQKTIDCFNRLEAIGAYPIDETETKNRGSRIIRALVNHKQLWIFICRVFHIIPLKLRLRT